MQVWRNWGLDLIVSMLREECEKTGFQHTAKRKAVREKPLTVHNSLETFWRMLPWDRYQHHIDEGPGQHLVNFHHELNYPSPLFSEHPLLLRTLIYRLDFSSLAKGRLFVTVRTMASDRRQDWKRTSGYMGRQCKDSANARQHQSSFFGSLWNTWTSAIISTANQINSCKNLQGCGGTKNSCKFLFWKDVLHKVIHLIVSCTGSKLKTSRKLGARRITPVPVCFYICSSN